MRHYLRLLAPVTLGALSSALTSCGDQTTQPNLPANPPIAAANALAPNTWIQRAQDPVDRVGRHRHRSQCSGRIHCVRHRRVGVRESAP